jgi:hypothetical protein
MKAISEKEGIDRLAAIRVRFGERMRTEYEHAALPCSVCPTPGACCLDEHFVNVRIARLEAAAIRKVLAAMPEDQRRKVEDRIEAAVTRYKLDEALDPETTYACPLFEKGVGCLVHAAAKPLPCIAHACYERDEDLPPDEILNEAELLIDKLNERVYREPSELLPIPYAIIARRN